MKNYSEYKQEFERAIEDIRKLDAREIYREETGYELRWDHGKKGACPFCGSGTRGSKDSTGAFHYYQGSNSFYCWSCNKAADAIEIVQQVHGFRFREAVHYIAAKYLGRYLENPYEKIDAKPAKRKNIPQWQAPSAAELEEERRQKEEKTRTKISIARKKPHGELAAEYLRGRGIDTDKLAAGSFYQLDAWQNLPAKVVFLDSTGTYLNARYIGVVPEGVGKNHDAGEKKDKLYDASFLSGEKEFFLTEGVINALSFRTLGRSALAFFDAHNIPTRAETLKKYIAKRTITIAGDPDPAGMDFAIGIAEYIFRYFPGTQVRMLLFPEKKDANDLLQEGTLEQWLKIPAAYVSITPALLREWNKRSKEAKKNDEKFYIAADFELTEKQEGIRIEIAEKPEPAILERLHIAEKGMQKLNILPVRYYEQDGVRYYNTPESPVFRIDFHEKSSAIWRPYSLGRFPEFQWLGEEQEYVGLWQVETEIEKHRKEKEAALEVEENPKQKEKLRKKKNMERVILTYTLQNAIALWKIDVPAIFLLSGKCSGETHKTLHDNTEKIFIAADWDTRQRAQAKSLGLFYIDIYIYQTEKKYGTLAAMIAQLYEKGHLPEFFRSLNTALPMRFWDTGKNGKPEVNLLSLFQFLQAHGFYVYEEATAKGGYFYVHIDGRIVRKYEDREEFVQHVRRFVDDWLRNRGESIQVRNALLKATELSEKNIAMLKRIEIDFQHGDRHSQLWFFRDGYIWKATKNGIQRLPATSLQKYIWDDEILPFPSKPIRRPFRIFRSKEYEKLLEAFETETDPEKKKLYRKKITQFPVERRWDIEILDRENYFLQFLWLTSYLFWREAEEKGYYIDRNHFWYELEKEQILEPQKIRLMKLHLINKITWLGYAIEDYRGPEHDYGLAILDAIDLENEGYKREAAGGGKSLITRAIAQIKRTLFVDAARPDITIYKHRYERYSGEKVIVLDDMHRDSRIGDMLNDFSLGVTINVKHQKEVNLALAESPKIIITRNYIHQGEGLRVDRRLGLLYVADFFHDSKSGKYSTDRKPKQFFGFSFFHEDTDERKAQLMNFFAWAYVEYKNWGEVNTPTQELVKFRAIKDIGEQLIEFLDNTLYEIYEENGFSEADPQRLLIDIIWLREKFIADNRDSLTRYEIQKKYATTQNFKKFLHQYCELRNFEYNPQDILELYSRDGKKIIRRSDRRLDARGQGKTAEHIYIRVPAETLSDWKEINTPVETSEEMPF